MSERKRQLVFRFTWRDYQKRFLDRFQEHLTDGHLHVVAPPGSGKTILGLEMLLRVNKTTLVLAPTLTIRDQWLDRLQSFFVKDTPFRDYSLSIKTPKQITFSTYQSLNALDKRLSETTETLIDFIRSHGIGTIVLDEAHHLKNEWWKSLFALKKIEDVTIIALTATPPYDSTAYELGKYFELCGPIDDEIAVPDLVKNGDLCPHQDFVYFSKPQESQVAYILNYREQIMAFIDRLLQDEAFRQLLLELPHYANTADALEEVYENPGFFSAILIFLNAAGHKIDKNKLHFLGFKGDDITFPSLSYEWLETLLQELLVTRRDSLVTYESILRSVEKELSRIGAYEKKRVDFVGGDQLYRSLANSPSKLESIAAILKAEKQELKDDLKAVVLTDFIRKEFLNFLGTDPTSLNNLGVISIFQYVRSQTDLKTDLAVLTGSVVILHNRALLGFENLMGTEGFQKSPLPGDLDFVIVSPTGAAKSKVVAAITELFENGTIRVLIGTKSLLGEGWDAPAMNTLVLASYVGSFVSSNQMRGRAIRVDSDNPGKTGNIWHLACIDPTMGNGGRDMEKLKRRFESFSGVSARGVTYIENGIERLELPIDYGANLDLERLNRESLALAVARSALKGRWFEAIAKGSILLREVKLPYLGKLPYQETKKLRWGNASKYLFLEIITGIGLFFPEFLAKHIDTLFGKGIFQFIYMLLVGLALTFAVKTYKAIRLYIVFGDTYKKTKKIARAILAMGYAQHHFHTAREQVSIVAEQQGKGVFVCYLKGASNAESSVFVNLLAEVLAPIENPRYLMEYRHWIKRYWGMRNYYVVPALFGKRKSDAQQFHGYWKEHVNDSKLVYTRTVLGRKLLLKARLSHILYQFKEVPEKAITWK